MNKIKEFFKGELSGWKSWEVIWLVLGSFLVTFVSFYLGDDLTGICAALTGILCVICTGKGKLSAYIFGTVNVVLYAIIALNAKYYGEVMLNLLYFLPLQFYGFYVWYKNINPETNEVYKFRLSNKNRILLLAIVALMTIIYGYILSILNGSLPYVDALSTVISVVAMIISIKMYMEQWILWIIIDVVTVLMWIFALLNGTGSIAVLIMWSVYLINAFIMYFKWKNESERRYNEI